MTNSLVTTFLGTFMGLSVASEASTIVAGNLTANRYFEDAIGDESYAGWVTGGGWTPDSGKKQLVMVFANDGNTQQWSVASTSMSTGGLYDLTAEPDVISVSGYDASTAMLTDLTWKSDHWFGQAAVANLGGDLDARLYLEVDISTLGGNYRMVSEQLQLEQGNVPNGVTNFTEYHWSGGSFSGDPFAGPGIALDQITDIQYKLVMHTVTGNSGAAGAYFFTADNVGLNYEVTIPAVLVPEPSTSVMVGLAAFGFLVRRQR